MKRTPCENKMDARFASTVVLARLAISTRVQTIFLIILMILSLASCYKLGCLGRKQVLLHLPRSHRPLALDRICTSKPILCSSSLHHILFCEQQRQALKIMLQPRQTLVSLLSCCSFYASSPPPPPALLSPCVSINNACFPFLCSYHPH